MSEEGTRIEMIDHDDDVELIDERQDLLSRGKKVVKSKSAKVSCCKALVITVAVIIFIAILIQIWADYGSYLETHSLPPAIHSMSSHCMEPLEDDCMTKNYNTPTCVFTARNTSSFVDVECTASKPNHHMVETNLDHIMFNMSWHDNLQMVFSSKPTKCLHLTIWSI
jgi:hypothetical protein